MTQPTQWHPVQPHPVQWDRVPSDAEPSDAVQRQPVPSDAVQRDRVRYPGQRHLVPSDAVQRQPVPPDAAQRHPVRRHPVLVVGIGSPAGDDAVGPAVAAAVAGVLQMDAAPVAAPESNSPSDSIQVRGGLGAANLDGDRSPGADLDGIAKGAAKAATCLPSAGPSDAAASESKSPPDSIQVRRGLGAANLDGVPFRDADLDGIARGAAEVVEQADPTDLVALMSGRELVVAIDAVRNTAAPGTLVLREVGAGHPSLVGWPGRPTSSHGWGLAEAVELARVLEQLPERVVVVGVAGTRFDPGAPLTDPVARALPAAVDAVLAQVRSPARRDESGTNSA